MRRGFTLIELLVVIAIIGLLSTIVMVSLNSARAKARDAKRLSDMKQIVMALGVYYDQYGYYPGNTDNNCSGWDAGLGGADTFIAPLKTSGIMTSVPVDPKSDASCWTYQYYYYLYPAGEAACDVSRGAFFVLCAYNMETSGNPHPQSPGWSCPNRNWQGEFDWVTGGFEN